MSRQYFNSLICDPLINTVTIGSPATSLTAFFTTNQATQYFPIGTGASCPQVGQVFRFAFGGQLNTPAGANTLTISLCKGTTVSVGNQIATSPAQTVPASLVNAPYRVEGELVWRTVSDAANSSTAVANGQFITQGILATAGTGTNIPFVTNGAASIDTTGGGTAGSFGAINFGLQFSLTGASINVFYTAWQSLN